MKDSYDACGGRGNSWKARIVPLLEGDVNDFVRARGVDAFRDLLVWPMPPGRWTPDSGRRSRAGLLRTYVEYASELTDAPVEYHIVCALVALATAAGNGIYFEQWGRQRIFPVLWVVLISPSGWFRKTTVVHIMKRILVDAGLGEALLAPQWSRESLLDVLAHRPAGLLTYGEFGSFLAMLGRDDAFAAAM